MANATAASDIATGTAIWYHGCLPPLAIRSMIVRDSTSRLKPQVCLAIEPDVSAETMLTHFVSQWQMDVTLEEVQAHLGIEIQRQ